MHLFNQNLPDKLSSRRNAIPYFSFDKHMGENTSLNEIHYDYLFIWFKYRALSYVRIRCLSAQIKKKWYIKALICKFLLPIFFFYCNINCRGIFDLFKYLTQNTYWEYHIPINLYINFKQVIFPLYKYIWSRNPQSIKACF